MSNDRELLELAAKAAGFEIDWSWQKERDELIGKDKASLFIKNVSTGWNPLGNDGDALRLAVKLRIKLGYDDNMPPEIGLPRECGYALYHNQWFAEHNPLDPCAATRRAIVRAAAEIGRAMK